MTKRTKPAVWIRILTFLLSLVLFCSAGAALLLGTTQMILQKDNMTTLIRQSILAPAQSDDLLVKFLYDTVMAEFGDRLGGEETFGLEDMQAFVDESTIKDAVAELSACLISDLLHGENTATISGEAVAALLKENAEVIKTHFEAELTDEVLTAVTTMVNEHAFVAQVREQGLAAVIMGTVTDETTILAIDQLLAELRTCASGTPLLICLAVSLVCAVLIIVLNLKWLARGLYSCGMPLLLASLPAALVTGCALTMGEAWLALFTGDTALIGRAITAVLTQSAPMTLGVCGGGLALLIAALVVKIVTGSKRKDEEIINVLSDALIEEEPVLISSIIDKEMDE